jgi:hypothetical protein
VISSPTTAASASRSGSLAPRDATVSNTPTT